MTGNSILDNLLFDRESGQLTYNGVRYLLIRPETITSLQREAAALNARDPGEILFRGGFTGAGLSTKKFRDIFGLSDEEILEFMMKMGTEIGWGRFRLNRYDPGEGILRVSVKNSPFPEAYGRSEAGVCHLIRGVLCGMGTAIFDRACTATEVNCAAMGDEECLFEVTAGASGKEQDSLVVDVLEGKKILVVDDEPDILQVMEELLPMCRISTAADFERARDLLERKGFDAAVLDIMGVNGYDLLKITREMGIPTLMLTAHALNRDNFVRSIENGALAYIPKDRISDMAIFLRDILEAQTEKRAGKARWFSRLEKFFEENFGRDWKEGADPEFWKKHFFI